MIRILIADELSAGTIDKLNEIPEFEIIEKINLSPEKLAMEIKNVEAVVVGGATRLTAAVLKAAVNLKVIVRDGNGPKQVDNAMARQKNIEIRSTLPLAASHLHPALAENKEHDPMDVIAILKDFFNV
jgi:phosphoglycerate dehydrogenase-like enzyme